jgi:hypothetical protein
MSTFCNFSSDKVVFKIPKQSVLFDFKMQQSIYLVVASFQSHVVILIILIYYMDYGLMVHHSMSPFLPCKCHIVTILSAKMHPICYKKPLLFFVIGA